ncbi:hypothetical protein GGS20DRAFT_588818 [Poronia punctata]|nr:hypothetical protein GGS20DRAFT_588818 [Poronia punctata]
MSSSTTFSYAQAARGKLAAQAIVSQPNPDQSQSQASSVTDSQSRDTTNTTAGTRTRDPSVAVSTTSNDADARSISSSSVKPEGLQFNDDDTNKDEHPSSASVDGSLDSTKLRTDQPSVDGSHKRAESRGRSTTMCTEDAELESKKAKKPKKGKSEKDSDTEQETKEVPPPKVELSEAPIPTVNPWHQRQQAQKAKMDQGSHATGAGAALQASSEAKPRETVEGSKQLANGKHVPRRDGDVPQTGTHTGPKRSAPRGARGQEKNAETLSTSNLASWPTPDTATNNVKPQLQTPPEKPEKVEKEDNAASKPKQKDKWVQLENFVPTVKFETVLPTRGRGGRAGGSRGGRDAAGGNHNVNSTDRTQEGSGKANSGSKRPQGEAATTRENRKNASQAEQSKPPRQSELANTNADQTKANPSALANGTPNDTTGGQAPTSSRPVEETGRNTDSHKDIRLQGNRDSHHQGHGGSSHRGNERARGGGRGRGGSNQHNTNGMSHHAQHSYSSAHAYPFQPNSSRPMAHYATGYQPMPYAYPSQAGPGQRRATNGNRRHGSGRVPSLVPVGLAYDPNMYAPAPYTYVEANNNLLQLAQTQVEYYFSVENCVKDWYLRQHMDSQGFVPISFIAQFNRMRELLVDINTLRQACIESTVLELVIGNDGVERVRSKKDWEKWVIKEMELRDPSARHDGPSTWQQFTGGYQPPMMSPPYHSDMSQVYPPPGDHVYGHYPNGTYAPPPLNISVANGTNGQGRSQESQLSATVPEFSPSTTTAPNGPEAGSHAAATGGEEATNKQTNGILSSHEHSSAMANGAANDDTEAVGSHVANGVNAVSQEH